MQDEQTASHKQDRHDPGEREDDKQALQCLKCANTVKIQTIRSTQVPRIVRRAGSGDYLAVIGKQSGEIGAPQRNWHSDHSAEKHRFPQRDSQYFFAAGVIPGSVILPGECGSCLPEGGDHIISEVFKIHGNSTSGSGAGTEAVTEACTKILARQNTTP